MNPSNKIRKKHKCGCLLAQNEKGGWVIDEYCDMHKPNLQKKADKLMHRINKKHGRGYTKKP